MNLLLFMCSGNFRRRDINNISKNKLGIRLRNIVSLENLFYIAFVNGHYLIYAWKRVVLNLTNYSSQTSAFVIIYCSGNFRRWDINNTTTTHVPIHKFNPLKDTMSTPVTFVGEYPMGRNQAKMVESTTNVSSVERNGNLQRFDITPKTARNWAEMVENYRLTLRDDKVDFHCLATETTKRHLVQKTKKWKCITCLTL